MSEQGLDDFYNGNRSLSVGQKLARIHWPVILVLCLIAATGVMSLYSVADGSLSPWGDRQIVRFLLGLALVLVIAVIPRGFWLAAANPIYVCALAAIALVLVIGSSAGGARRWIEIGGISFQPSEVMKVALILALARYYQWLPQRWVSHPFGMVVPVAMIALPMGLTVLQPDLGTAVLFGIVGMTLMFLAVVHWGYFVAGAGGLVALLPLLWEQLHDYQRRRIEIFLNPQSDPLASGYHITQSKIALGSGGISGKGFMQGTQGKLDFLPEKHTDFIFTNFGEEWGFIGAMVLLGMFVVLITLLLIMSLRCASQFARLTIAGTAMMIFVYVFINVAMVTGLMPVVGVPLPLVSYGGTSMLTVMLAIGLAMCAYVHRGRWFLRGELGPFW
jgi:rod shape determining protein RodA